MCVDDELLNSTYNLTVKLDHLQLNITLYEDCCIKHFNIVIENVYQKLRVNIISFLNDHKSPRNSHNNIKQLDDRLFSFFFSKERGCD